MDFNTIFNNISEKNIFTYYSVECSEGFETIFSTINYDEAVEVFHRAIECLKKNDYYDRTVYRIDIFKNTMSNIGIAKKDLLLYAERKNDWIVKNLDEEIAKIFEAESIKSRKNKKNTKK